MLDSRSQKKLFHLCKPEKPQISSREERESSLRDMEKSEVVLESGCLDIGDASTDRHESGHYLKKQQRTG